MVGIPHLKGVGYLCVADSKAAQNWMAQYSVWQLMHTDSSYADSSADLAQFYTMAQNSRYGWLTNIENAIVSGDDATAKQLLAADIDAYVNTDTDPTTGVVMADGIGADNVVANYISLFNLYELYKDSLMTGADSLHVLAMANLCPYTDGNVVYQARALYRILYEDDETVFNDVCGMTDTTGGGGLKRNNGVNAAVVAGYKLYPNPNEGSFMLRQQVADARPVHVEVRDVLGRSVYSREVQFAAGTAQLQLDQLASGVYMLQLTDAEQKTSNFKFVIQK